MAAKFKVPNSRNTEYNIYPEEIVIKPENNGRTDPADVEKILRSFEMIGQIQPVSIHNVGGQPVLISGFTRWQAAMMFNEGKPTAQRMRLRCVLNRGDALQNTIRNVHENHYRNPTTELDNAHNIAKLMDGFGKSHEDVAEIYGETVAWVKKTLRLLKLSEETQQAVRSGRVKLTAAEKLISLTEEQQKMAVASGGKLPGPAKPSAKKVREAIQLVADSPAYHSKAREFAANLLKFMAGEVDDKAL